MKKFKVKYERYLVAEMEIEAPDLETAKEMAELKKPGGYETTRVYETTASVLHPLFEDLSKIFKPNNT